MHSAFFKHSERSFSELVLPLVLPGPEFPYSLSLRIVTTIGDSGVFIAVCNMASEGDKLQTEPPPASCQSEVKGMEDRSLLQNIRRPPKLSTPALVISKLIVTALPIAQVSIGAIYLHDCPRQPYIPIYLLVSGVFALVLGLLSCLPCTQEPEDGAQTPLSSLCTAWNSLVSLFLFCWFIAGNVWIYSIYQPDYQIASAANYCNKTLYLFAFWTTTVIYILMGVIFVGGCCMFFCLCLCGRSGNVEDV